MAETSSDKPIVKLARVWQLPVLLVSIVMLVVGLFLAKSDRPQATHASVLDKAAEAIDAGQHQAGYDQLQEMISQIDDLSTEDRGRFHALVADAVYLIQHSEGGSRQANHRRVVENYEQSMLTGPLTNERLERLIDSLLAMGETGKVEELLPSFGEAPSPARQRLLRRMIERGLAVDEPNDQQIEKWIGRLLDESARSGGAANVSARIWAVARQADRLIASDQANEAVDMLLQRIRRFDAEGAKGVGELNVLLGEAYFQIGDLRRAEQSYADAERTLGTTDSLRGAVHVGRGRIMFAEDNVVEALEQFEDTARRYPGTPGQIQALVGQAECESRLSTPAEAKSSYATAVELVGRRPGLRGRHRVLVLASLIGQQEEQFGQGRYEEAGDFLKLAARLYEADTLPAELRLKQARTHEQIARQIRGMDEDATSSAPLELLDEADRARAAGHYEQAAEHYLAHSRAVKLTNNLAYGQSLWRAANCFDQAGLADRAIEQFGQFVRGRPSDPRHLAAIFRLGQAYQLDLQFDAAIEHYQRLISDHPKSPEAYGSFVPLAQCYLAKGSQYEAQAEQQLLAVVEQHPALRPESREYRQALIELGRLYYRRGGEGDYERAIERFREAVTRYVDHAAITDLWFQLGDAYRKSVAQIDRELAGTLAPAQRAEFRQERQERLEKADVAFERVIADYEQADLRRLTELQKLYLRNSYFYRGDCAYKLKRFEDADGAIALYTTAVQRYEKDPAILAALVQMVNAYCEMGRIEEARAIHRKAESYLKQLPDEAFEDPDLLMSREHWQRWWDSTARLAAGNTTQGIGTTP